MRKHKDATTINEIIEWMIKYSLDNGYMPKIDEICAGLNRGRTTIQELLSEARALKMIDWIPYQPRTYQIPGIYYCDDR